MRDAFPHLFKTSPDLLYQLVTMLSPSQLKQRGVPVHRLVHHEGSFVITFPNAYHAGFNTGRGLPQSNDELPRSDPALSLKQHPCFAQIT